MQKSTSSLHKLSNRATSPRSPMKVNAVRKIPGKIPRLGGLWKIPRYLKLCNYLIRDASLRQDPTLLSHLQFLFFTFTFYFFKTLLFSLTRENHFKFYQLLIISKTSTQLSFFLINYHKKNTMRVCKKHIAPNFFRLYNLVITLIICDKFMQKISLNSVLVWVLYSCNNQSNNKGEFFSEFITS